MELKDLEKMTVVKLREEAAKYEDVKGVTGMSKEDLIDLLCDKNGIARKKRIPTGIGRRALKAKIRQLHGRRPDVLKSGDSKSIHTLRRRLKSLRRRLRRLIVKAEHGKIKAKKEEGGATA
ncbi:MAG TPA: hypothetical protein VJV23_07465 [Candidatus Polarisedimenticolia bacterium]|nr:hypothetical protein [Candidatus Polarisedimenticolia bacterium]